MGEFTKPILTSAERRGFIALLVVVAIVIAGIALSKQFNVPTATIVASDTVTPRPTTNEWVDSIPPRQSKKKKRQTASSKPKYKSDERDPFHHIPRH